MPDDLLFDASSIVALLVGGGGSDVEIGIVFDEHLLDLTLYEAANALWKIGLVRDRLTESELNDSIAVLDRLGGEARIERVTGDGLTGTLDASRASELTFYDAAYLATARRGDLTLVTEDGALEAAARDRNVATRSLHRLS